MSNPNPPYTCFPLRGAFRSSSQRDTALVERGASNARGALRPQDTVCPGDDPPIDVLIILNTEPVLEKEQ
jgi:hypothetical protein